MESASTVSSTASSTSNSDSHNRRRVKLYSLNAERQWDDRGTGHVSCIHTDRLKGTALVLRAELDGAILLESKVQQETTYQKQQETLIVWSEGENFDLALSFQEKIGCDEIWNKICQIQGKDPNAEYTQDIVEESEDERLDDMSDGGSIIELPLPDLSKLDDISKLLASSLTSQSRKEKLALAMESDHYIRKLIDLFHICEDLDNIDALRRLYDIFKSIFFLNQNTLFETMFAEDTIFDVVGCLEYEPGRDQPKKHREYLKELATFKEAIPIRNPELIAKIHQTYRVQYIQDVVLPTPSVFEENILSALTSFIFLNKVDIVKMIEEDERFLSELFELLTDADTPDTKRRDLVLFLKEFCYFSQNLQPQDKESFYKTLVTLGILPALEITLGIDDRKTKTASIDILMYIVEFSPSVIRDYTLKQANNTHEVSSSSSATVVDLAEATCRDDSLFQEQLLLNIIIDQMLKDRDPELGGAVQLMGVLRILLDPENMISTTKSSKTDFLNFFYEHGMQTLIAPLLTNTCGDKPRNEEYHTVQLLGLVLELLSFCVEHHSYHIKNWILNMDLLRRILVLMNSDHKFLVLGALRFMRKIIALKDEYYNRYIIKGNLFKPVIDVFFKNNGKYNLLDSAILELFEFIMLEEITSLCSHVVENFGKTLDEIQYVKTFQSLKTKCSQPKDNPRTIDRGNVTGVVETVVPSLLRTNKNTRRDPRQLDEDEEMWFDEEEPFEGPPEENPIVSSQPSADLDSIGKLMEKKNENNVSKSTLVITNHQDQVHLAHPKLFNKGLVDYEGDSDEEDDSSNSDGSKGDDVGILPSAPPLTPPPEHSEELTASADSPGREAKRPRLS